MRLFVAINLDKSVRDSIARAIEALPAEDPPWRWIPEQSLHITLKFLGEQPADALTATTERLSIVSGLHAPFSLSLGHFGAFPRMGRPRVLFYAVNEGSEPLRNLANDVDASLSKLDGVAPNSKPFQPHVTVARIKKQLSPDIVQMLKMGDTLEGACQQVKSIDLMESELSGAGSIYRCVRRFELGGALR